MLEEAVSNYWEELILEEMGFDMGVYPKRIQGTWFYPSFKKWGKKRFSEYIGTWDEGSFEAPEFMKTYLRSWNKVRIERHPKRVLEEKLLSFQR